MHKIAILYDASQAVLSTFDLDEVLRQILSIARNYFHLQNVSILLLDPQTNELVVKTEIGYDTNRDGMRIALGQGLTGTAAQQKRTIYAPDVNQNPAYLRCCEATRSEVSVPLMVRDQLVGVLDCQSDQLDFFSAEVIDLLTLFSTQASIALENARLYSLERQRAEQLEAINAIAQQMTVVLEPQELMNNVCAEVRKAFAADHVSILLRDGEQMTLRAHEGSLTLREGAQAPLPRTVGPWGRALLTGRSVVETNVEDDGNYVPLLVESRARLCVPLVSFGHVVGVLLLDSTQANAFEGNDWRTVESVADMCATAIQNTQHVERVRQLAYIDGLTGIFNRRFFDLRIAEEIERASRFHLPLAVLMTDIDRFKQLNDEFGHLLGDEILRQVSSIWSQQLRKMDVACRYGGDEFAIVLPQTGAEQAMQVAEKVRHAIADWAFPGVPRPVTISVGAAAYPVHGGTRDDLVKAADRGLYAAKQAGRNRVFMATAQSEAAGA